MNRPRNRRFIDHAFLVLAVGLVAPASSVLAQRPEMPDSFHGSVPTTDEKPSYNDGRPAALVHVGALENLISLNLFGTAITDAGLQHLARLTHLNSLYLGETKVTAEGVARLQKDLPNVQIDTGTDLKDLAKKEPTAPAKPQAK